MLLTTDLPNRGRCLRCVQLKKSVALRDKSDSAHRYKAVYWKMRFEQIDSMQIPRNAASTLQQENSEETVFKTNDNKWVATLGATGELGLKIFSIFGTSWIPGWGQVILLGYAFWNFGQFIGSLNPDDGIGAIRITGAPINNFCLGTHTVSSQFNGNDADSINDYDVTFRVEELPVQT
jgi:hypothetical protein